MKCLLRSLLSVLIWGGVSFGSAQALPRELRQTIIEASVQIWSSIDDDYYSLGSGTVISPDGYILTNFHVIGDIDTGRAYSESDHAILVTDPDATHLAPEHRYWARLVHEDTELDLAVLEIVQTAARGRIPATQRFAYVEVGDSDSLEIGDDITVVGYPDISGATVTLTRGTMSGWLGEDGGSGRDWIKTDAALNQGNSGGGAFNGRGELVGVPTVVVGRRGNVPEKQGFLRPINQATFLGDYTPSRGDRPAADADDDVLAPIVVATSDSTVVGEIGIGQHATGSLTGDGEDGFSSWHTFVVRVPEGGHFERLLIRMTADRDLDLAVKFGSEIVGYSLDETDYMDASDARSALIVIERPQAGSWYIDVFNAQGPSVTGSYTLSIEAEACRSANCIPAAATPEEPPAPESEPRAEIPDEREFEIRPGDDLIGIIAALPEGGAVRLTPGEYRLTDVLNIQRNLTLVGGGAGRDDVRITSTAEGAVIRFGGEGTLAIRGVSLTHEGEAWADVLVVERGEVSIEDSRFAGAAWHRSADRGGSGLVFLPGARGGTVRGSEFVQNRYGTQIGGRARPALEENVYRENDFGIRFADDAVGLARDNTLENNAFGMAVNDRARPTLEGNSVTGNEFFGIIFLGDAGGLAQNNTIVENGLYGMRVVGRAQPTLDSNLVQGNNGTGLSYAEEGGGVARNNTVSDNMGVGIQVGNQARPLLEGNLVHRNQLGGLGYSGDATGVARSNTIDENSDVGVRVTDRALPILEGNTIRNNELSGIEFQAAAGGAARNNTIENNRGGIQVLDRAQPVIERNTVRRNGATGLIYADTSGGTARDNTIEANRRGIQIQDSAQPTLEGNRVLSNDEIGLFYTHDAGGVARDNTISDNDTTGILIRDRAQPTLEGNTVRHNRQGGLLYRDDAGGAARGNIVSENTPFDIAIRDRAQPNLDRPEAAAEDARPEVLGEANPAAQDDASPDMLGEPAPAQLNVDARPGDDLIGIVAALPAGSTVHLPPGEYRLSGVLEIHGSLTLVGEGADPSDIRIVSGAEETAIRFGGEGILTIRGISIAHVGDAWADVLRVEGGEILIENSRLLGARQDASGEFGGRGLLLGGDSRGVVRDSELLGNSIAAVMVVDRAQPTLEGNTLQGNGIGIRYSGTAGGVARDNLISDNNATGISVGGAARPSLLDNNLMRNALDGLAFFDTAGGEARNNQVLENSVYGVLLRNRAQPTLVGNTVHANATGLAYFEEAGGLARGNTVTENRTVGIQIEGQAQPTLEGNTVQHNDQGGLAFFDEAAGTASENLVSDNGFVGIQVQDRARPALVDNTIERNRGVGLLYLGNAGGTARNNIVSGNAMLDIEVLEPARPTLEGNTVPAMPESDVAGTDPAGDAPPAATGAGTVPAADGSYPVRWITEGVIELLGEDAALQHRPGGRLRLAGPGGSATAVTCTEYLLLSGRGFSAETVTDRDTEDRFERECRLLLRLAIASASSISYLDDFRLSDDAVGILPLPRGLGAGLGNEATLGDLAPDLRLDRADDTSLVFDGEGYVGSVTILAWGDIDGDRVEDLLLEFEFQRDGAQLITRRQLLTRLGAGAPLQDITARLAPLPPDAWADRPSFDCDRAVSWAEQAICRTPTLTALDLGIASVYFRLLEELPAAAAQRLRDEQHAWLPSRETCSTATAALACLEQRMFERLLAVQVFTPTAAEVRAPATPTATLDPPEQPEHELFALAGGTSIDDLQAVIAADPGAVNLTDAFGQTPLMYAVDKEYPLPEVVGALIAAGADVNARTRAGWTPLMYAARRNRTFDVLLKLLDAGADPALRDSEGQIAFDVLRSNAALRSVFERSGASNAAPPASLGIDTDDVRYRFTSAVADRMRLSSIACSPQSVNLDSGTALCFANDFRSFAEFRVLWELSAEWRDHFFAEPGGWQPNASSTMARTYRLDGASYWVLFQPGSAVVVIY